MSDRTLLILGAAVTGAWALVGLPWIIPLVLLPVAWLAASGAGIAHRRRR